MSQKLQQSWTKPELNWPYQLAQQCIETRTRKQWAFHSFGIARLAHGIVYVQTEDGLCQRSTISWFILPQELPKSIVFKEKKPQFLSSVPTLSYPLYYGMISNFGHFGLELGIGIIDDSPNYWVFEPYCLKATHYVFPRNIDAYCIIKDLQEIKDGIIRDIAHD